MKKIIALFSFLALTFSLSGCMSAEEKMKAEEDERLAVPIVEKYLSENYEGAVISKTTYLERNKSSAVAVPDFGVYATGYCVSQIDYGSNDFSVIVNTDTGECWDNFNYKQLRNDIADKIKSGIDSADIDDVEVNVYYKDFPSTLWADNCVGFSKKSDNVLASDEYIINVLLKCDGDISRLDYSKLKEYDIKSEVSVAAVTFYDQYNMNDIRLDSKSYDLTLNEDYEEQHRILDEKLQFQYAYDYNQKACCWSEVSYEDYECVTIGDFTFSYDSYGVKVYFNIVAADETYTDKNSTYTSLNGTAVTVTYDTDSNYKNKDLFCWTDNKFDGNYLVLTSDGVRKDNVYKISGGSAKYGDYRKIDMSKLYDNQPFTVGIYRKDK